MAKRSPVMKSLERKQRIFQMVVRLQEVNFGIVQFYILHILHKLAVVIVLEDELSGISGKLSAQPVYDLFDVHFCHAALLLPVDDYPQAVSVGPLAPQFSSFLKFAHSALYRSQRNTSFCADIFLCYLLIVLDYLHNCLVVDIRLVFSIGANFGAIGAIGARYFRINDTILINISFFPIEIDAEIASHINQFWLTKAIFLCFSKHFWNAAAPSLHNIHVGKSGSNASVADLRETGLHFFNGDFAVQHTGGGNFQPVIKECYLDFTRCQVASMTDGVRDHLPDSLDGQFIVVLTSDSFDAGTEVDVLQHEVVGILDLLVYRAGKFLAGDEDVPNSTLEYRTLNGGIRELSRISIQKQIPIGGVVSSVAFHQQFP